MKDERGNISEELYLQIKHVVDLAMDYPNYKSAKGTIDQLDSLRDGTPLRCSFKIVELKGALIEYCKRNSDKEFYRQQINAHLYVLETMVDN
ncbi:MAG: hypothetical protein IJP78_11885 [Clostridia bacterium]|nr:hypothetical protein [Clostridia bacterium]